jgi:short-subunit dehydrogenase
VRAQERPVDALALNAGRSIGGAFVGGTPLDQDLLVIDLDVRSVVHLAKLLLPAMVERGEGRVLITSSVAATTPGPYQATYNASKSFIQSFSLAIREELKDTGVTVTALMPGPTETEVFERAEMMDTKIGTDDSKDSPALVARQAFEGMMAGDERVRGGGLSSKLQGIAGRLGPDSLKAKVFTRMARPGTD